MSLKKNILSLLGNQAVGYLVPLLQLPYLSRVLGVDLLGLYMFSLSLIIIGGVVTNFGFDISISKKIAEGECSAKELSGFLTNVSIAKTFLALISVLIFSLTAFFSGYYNESPNIIGLMSVVILVSAYMQSWLFQGIEKIYIYSRVMISAKLISLAMIFLLVHEAADLVWLFVILVFQSIFIVLVCQFYLFKAGINFGALSFQASVDLLTESSEYFFSRLGVAMYSTMGSFFLGVLSGSLREVALYGAAHQLYKAGVYVLSAVSTPLIPFMARTKNFKIFFKVTAASILITILGACLGWGLGVYILQFIFGGDFIDAKPVLNVFMVTIIFSVAGMHFGYPALIPLGKVRVANLSVIYAGCVQLLLIAFLYFAEFAVTAVWMAITYLICDLIMTAIRVSYFGRGYYAFKKT